MYFAHSNALFVDLKEVMVKAVIYAILFLLPAAMTEELDLYVQTKGAIQPMATVVIRSEQYENVL